MNLTRLERHNVISAGLCVWGLMNIVGYYANFKPLRGIAAASVASPLPKVFSDVEGLEPFASEFTLRAKGPGGESVEKRMTPELYQRLQGPYNRRNVYGAAIAFGPRLPRSVWEPILCYGLNGPLGREFELAPRLVNPEIHIQTRTIGRHDRWILDPHCAE